MSGGDSSEESDYDTDRSSIFDGLMAKLRQENSSWMGDLGKIILAPRQVCQEMGPIQELEKSMP